MNSLGGRVTILAESGNAADTTDDSAVELQSVSAAEDFAAGKVTASATSLVANGKEQTVTPTKVTTGSGVEITLTEQPDGTFKGSDGDTYEVTGNKGTDVKEYTLTVASTSDAQKTVSLKWNITPASLEGATAYEINPSDADDTSKTTFTYNGQVHSLAFQVNGVKLTPENSDAVVYTAGGDKTSITNLKDAGDYVVQLTGKKEFAGSKTNVKVTINKLDLSTADVTIADTNSTEAPSAADVKINGAAANTIAGVKTELKSSDLYDDNGEYTYTVSSTDSKNVTGSKDVTFAKYGTPLGDSNVKYGNDNWATAAAAGVNTDLDADAKDQKTFDASKITVTGTDGRALTSDQYTVNVTKADGSKGTLDDLKKPGDYKVTVSINSKATNYQYGGTTSELDVKVYHEKAAKVFVTIDGKLAGNDNGGGSYSKTYDGKAVTPTVVVKDSDGNALTEGTDYKVAYKKLNAKTGQYETVSEIKDQGTYQVVVTPGTGWTLDKAATDDVTTVTVNPVEVTGVDTNKDEQLATTTTSSVDNKPVTTTTYAYAYQDGNEIKPTYVFTQKDKDGKNVEVEVPADAYKTVITQLTDANKKPVNKVVDAIKDEGTYEVSFKDAVNGDNYNIANDLKVDITVSAKRSFKDVPANAWYAQAVQQAKEQGLMNGYANTDFFGPEDTLTRGQTAQVMFNISGGDYNFNAHENYKDATGSFVTPFADVDGSLWYAEPIAWANAMNVMNGYKGSDNFGPNDTITREQFAQTLVNYAKQVKKYNAADASVLDSYADKDSVDSWATDAVAWAVQNGIMGVNSNLDATGNITRAQAAAMLVRFNAVLGLK